MAEKPKQSGRRGRRGWWAALTGALSYWLWRRWRSGGQEQPAAAVRQRSMEQGHEEETTSTPGVLISVALIVALVAVSVWGIVAFIGVLEEEGTQPVPELRVSDVGEAPVEDIPRPRLQVDPGIDLQDLHRWEHERLHTYGRIDGRADSTRLHVPIGRAMKLIARRGLPADTTASADTLLVPTESGFRVTSRRFPAPPRATPYLGSSPEPYTPAPAFLRYLTEEGYLPRSDSAR